MKKYIVGLCLCLLGCAGTVTPPTSPAAAPTVAIAEGIATLADTRTMNRSALDNGLIQRALFDANVAKEDQAEALLLSAQKVLASGGTASASDVDSAKNILKLIQSSLPKKGP